MKITVISDMHGRTKNTAKIQQFISESSIVLVAGDLSRGGNLKSAECFISGLENYSKNILAVHGNWDTAEVIEMLTERKIMLHGRGMIVGDTGFFGSGGSNPTPLHTASEYTDDEIYESLQAGYEKIKSAQVKILLSHTPPFSTLDKTFLGIRAGSRSVLKFIGEKKIDYCICGHIHEARGIIRHGDTVILNAGSFANGWFAVVDTDSKKNELYKIGFFGKITLKETIEVNSI